MGRVEPTDSMENSSAEGNDTVKLNHHYAGGEDLASFYYHYQPIHGYLASVVCVFGILANILNIIVLTRKNMISATNCILSGLAVSDGLTMTVYLPYALYFYCLHGVKDTPERNTLASAYFLLFYACFSVVVHTVSIWLTVTLAIFRYIFIKYAIKGAFLCSMKRAKIAVACVYVVTFLVCIPNFLTIDIIDNQENTHNSSLSNGTEEQVMYFVTFKKSSKTDWVIYTLNFWVQAIIIKLIPCIGLLILSILIIKTMREADARRKNLKKAANAVAMTTSTATGSESGGNCPDTSRDRRTNRTTRMLLIVVALFVLTELPQCIVLLLSGCLPHFQEEVYHPLGDLMDILALINNSINFILYCAMSKQFRDTFRELFMQPCSRATSQAHHGFQPVPTKAPDNTQTTAL